MTHTTIRRVVHEIRHRRAQLSAEETWWQQQPASETRAEGFRRIRFWREVLADAEQRLGRPTPGTEE